MIVISVTKRIVGTPSSPFLLLQVAHFVFRIAINAFRCVCVCNGITADNLGEHKWHHQAVAEGEQDQ